jgi:hypothetical protein
MKSKAAGAATFTTHPYLMSNVRTDGAIPLLTPSPPKCFDGSMPV